MSSLSYDALLADQISRFPISTKQPPEVSTLIVAAIIPVDVREFKTAEQPLCEVTTESTNEVDLEQNMSAEFCRRKKRLFVRLAVPQTRAFNAWAT